MMTSVDELEEELECVCPMWKMKMLEEKFGRNGRRGGRYK